MSTNTVDQPKKVTTTTVARMKQQGEKIAMITAYDYTMASLVDASGIDLILVGDSAANIMAGYETTLPMTLDHMIYHGQCVTRGAKRAMVIVDMPFGTYQGDELLALHSAVRSMEPLISRPPSSFTAAAPDSFRMRTAEWSASSSSP